VKNPALLYEVSFFSALWMVFPESWKRSCPNFYAHDCISRVSAIDFHLNWIKILAWHDNTKIKTVTLTTILAIYIFCSENIFWKKSYIRNM
jgi:hypothetical protein